MSSALTSIPLCRGPYRGCVSCGPYGWHRTLGRFEVESVSKVFSAAQDVAEEFTIFRTRDQRLYQIDLIHCDELQDFAAHFAVGMAWKARNDLDVLGRFRLVCSGERGTQPRFEPGQ